MKWFYNLKMSHKLGLGFGLCLALSLWLGITAIGRMAQMDHSADLIVSEAVAGSGKVADLTGQMRQYRILEFMHNSDGTSAGMTSIEGQINEEGALVMKSLSDYEKIASQADEKKLISDLRGAWQGYTAGHSKAIDLDRRGKNKESDVLMMARNTQFGAVKTLLDTIEEWNAKRGHDLSAESDKVYTQARGTVITLLIACAIVAILVGMLIARVVSSNLQQISIRMNSLETVCITNLATAVDSLARGDLTTKIVTGTEPLKINSTDEFGALAVNINKIVDKLQTTINAFGAAQDSLSSLLAQARTSSDTMSQAASEVSTGNTDLSQRTEEQAASLEETASSMEEMTSTIKQNADNARLANQLASQARQVAEDGGMVVKDAVTAMGEINEGSKRIAAIISVIDEIAFQTNLLALNAAVEAARVGEQGRGFAVVAAEVRSLAGRSATAAKEIKALVQDSVGRVEEGSRLVNESGQRLDEIVGSVKKVADVIAEISAASIEQSAGIEQVNKAIMQMDQVTQQNAALVEEVSAASVSMSRQAGDLQSLVARFTIEPKYLLTIQQSVTRPVAAPVARQANGTTGRPSTSSSRQAPTKLTVVAKDDEFEEF